MHPQIETKQEEDSLNNSNKEHFDSRHNSKCENCEEIEKIYSVKLMVLLTLINNFCQKPKKRAKSPFNPNIRLY